MQPEPVQRGPVPRSDRAVGGWLLGVAGMLLVMIVLGGVTRLTGSGLSIMEWAPLSGVLPPLSAAEWQRLFGLYRSIPQAGLLNPSLDLAGFQSIFWLEWLHRLWGRLIGLAFFIPLAWFWLRGQLPPRLRARLVLFFVLGALQGVIGWIMVASGFEANATAVSPYRLAAHLALGVGLYAAIVWTALGLLLSPAPDPPPPARPGTRRLALLATALLALTIVAGSLVAGLHAGLVYTSFPLMDGRLIPASYGALTPWLRNLTENVAAVQFDHRLLASLTAATILLLAWRVWQSRPRQGLRRAATALAALVALQYGLGVATLVYAVPVALAAAHQATAMLLLAALLVLLHLLPPACRPAAR